jgi:ABC-type Zn uptake system ZnuABC Zn-binding protein ZnuA
MSEPRAKRVLRVSPSLLRPLVAASLAAVLGSACSSGVDAGSAADDELVVATTVAPITSIAAAVIGGRAEIRGLVPEGTNSHTFEPPPSAAETLADADVLFLNGLQLEEPTKALAEANMADDAVIVELGEQTITEDQYLYDVAFPEADGKPNPHLWTNPPMAVTYAELIRDRMVELDPAHAAEYRTNTNAFADGVAELDAAMRTSFETVPDADRKLLTYHDAYAYFAEEYGWEVIGAIQVADFQEPTAAEVADLIDQVRAEDLPAIFGSEVFPSPVLERIGEEAGVTYVDVLRDDDLPGAPGEAEHSILGLLRANYIVLTEALGGDAAALRALDVALPVPDQAEYPQ